MLVFSSADTPFVLKSVFNSTSTPSFVTSSGECSVEFNQ